MTTYTAPIYFSPDAHDEAPSADIYGDPRFVTERDMAEADRWQVERDDEQVLDMEREHAAWVWEQEHRGGYWFP